MKVAIFTIPLMFWAFSSNAQIDSVSFQKSGKAELKTINVDEIMVNNQKMMTSGESTKFLSFEDDCNFIVPKYSQLNEGDTKFKKIKSDAKKSLAALGSSLSVERKSEF